MLIYRQFMIKLSFQNHQFLRRRNIEITSNYFDFYFNFYYIQKLQTLLVQIRIRYTIKMIVNESI